MDSSHYRFTLNAKNDLNRILAYISIDLSNPIAANNFLNKLLDKIDSICFFPESCPLVINEFIKNDSIRKANVGHYVIYYIYDENESAINIIRIIYGKRNLEEILKLL